MCESKHPSEAPGSEGESFALSQDEYTVKTVQVGSEEERQEAIGHHKASGAVVFGAFLAGSLVAVVICAPTILVLILAAGAAALTQSDSKAGKFSRKVRKVTSDIVLAVVKKGREMNDKHQVTDRAQEGIKRMVKTVQAQDEKRGITKSIKGKVASVWKDLDRRTSYQVEVVENAQVTDGMQLPGGSG